jgi:hypothetical protein
LGHYQPESVDASSDDLAISDDDSHERSATPFYIVQCKRNSLVENLMMSVILHQRLPAIGNH